MSCKLREPSGYIDTNLTPKLAGDLFKLVAGQSEQLGNPLSLNKVRYLVFRLGLAKKEDLDQYLQEDEPEIKDYEKLWTFLTELASGTIGPHCDLTKITESLWGTFRLAPDSKLTKDTFMNQKLVEFRVEEAEESIKLISRRSDDFATFKDLESWVESQLTDRCQTDDYNHAMTAALNSGFHGSVH